MTHQILPVPITEDQVRVLPVGDTVTLEETLYGTGTRYRSTCSTMATWVPHEGALVAPDATALDAAIAALEAPFARPARNLPPLRDALQELMWDKAGILGDAAGLADASSTLDALEAELDASRVDGANRAFNLTWHDWLNLKSLLLVSRAIVVASQAREESRGTHWREDFPQTNAEAAGLPATSVRLEDHRVILAWQPVAFTRLQPGESLLTPVAAE